MKKFKVKVYIDSELKRSLNAKEESIEYVANMDDSYTEQKMKEFAFDYHKEFKAKHPECDIEILKVEVKEVKSKK